MIAPAAAYEEFTIRQLAEEFDVTARTLRFYESKELLHPHRRGQSRIYSANDRARLNLILRGKRVGFSLNEISEMLDFEAAGTRGAAGLSDTIGRFRGRIAQLERQRDDIDYAIRDLEAGLAWLEARSAHREPSEPLKSRAAAFEALAKTWLHGDGAGAAE